MNLLMSLNTTPTIPPCKSSSESSIRFGFKSCLPSLEIDLLDYLMLKSFQKTDKSPFHHNKWLFNQRAVTLVWHKNNSLKYTHPHPSNHCEWWRIFRFKLNFPGFNRCWTLPPRLKERTNWNKLLSHTTVPLRQWFSDCVSGNPGDVFACLRLCV